MNIKNIKNINIKPASDNISKEQNKKLYTIKRANRNIGKKTANIDSSNVDSNIILFFEELGCSIENCNLLDYSLIDKTKKEKEIPTDKSFEDKDDPFYDGDCGKQAAKRQKEKKKQQEKKVENVNEILNAIIAEQDTSTSEENTNQTLNIRVNPEQSASQSTLTYKLDNNKR